MILFISLLYLITANFKQLAYFPTGTFSFCPPYAFDADHDGISELFILSLPDTGTMAYKHIGNNQYTETRLFGVDIVGIGNGDVDSLTDIYGQSAPYGQAIGIWESRNSNSYPDSLVWNYPMPDTEQAYSLSPGIFVDFDQDGRMNLITPIWPVDLLCFENVHDNYYILTDSLWLPSGGGPGEMVVDDFDEDGLLEMIGGDIDGKVYVWENTAIGVDSFQLVWTYQLPSYTGAAYMTAKGDDMDRDGRLEFIVGAEVSGTGRGVLTIFESNGNNSYHKVWQKIFQYSGNIMTYGDVDCGDIDGDGIDEVMSFIGLMLNVWKCVGPDSFVSIWDRSFMYDLTDGVLEIADLNQNGLGEVIVSGGNWGSTPPAKTYIYEKMPSVTWIYPAQYDTLWANDTVNLLWKLDETVSLESLRIYIAHPLMGCWLIHQGLPQDTTCLFVVPDTQSNMAFKFWVAVEGYLRYDSIVSPPFYIKRAPGIEEFANPNSAFRIPHLEVYPNPFTEKTEIRFTIHDSGYRIHDTRYRIQDASLKIYDVSGRIVRQWDYQTIRLSDQILWDGTDDSGRKLPSGVYFVRLETNKFGKTRKAIVLE